MPPGFPLCKTELRNSMRMGKVAGDSKLESHDEG